MEAFGAISFPFQYTKLPKQQLNFVLRRETNNLKGRLENIF